MANRTSDGVFGGCFVGLLCLCFLAPAFGAEYLIGRGKYDATGPAADLAMMGYAMPQQIVGGIHTRLYARAFLIAEPGENGKRFVVVNLDACMASQLVTMTALAKLKEKYGGLYTNKNVVVTGIHTHSGPGGYMQYVLYSIPSLGFVRESFDALVEAIYRAVSQAHDSLQPGSLSVASGELLDGNINRSPTAYLANPEEERARYQHDTDKTLTLLKFLNDKGQGLAAITWYAVHCTSINNTNALISGDNKGVASQFFEKWGAAQPPEAVVPGFVAGFGQSNVGDTSPNTLGAFCQDTGLPCEAHHSTCNGRNELCIGRGPAWPDHFKSNEIIAGLQATKAAELWGNETEEITGSVDYRHSYIDISKIEVKESNYTRAGVTCPAAMGFSFAAGTTDGPGAFDFVQEDKRGTIFWKVVSAFLKSPTQAQKDCHAPKPILLDTGEIHLPYEWQPRIVDISVLRVGQLVILGVPGEFTTMAGRRLREAVYDTVKGAWGENVRVVIAGLAGTYSSYITTFEEYQVQRYEGASTLYGPHTLDAYIQEITRLAAAMVAGEEVEPGPDPPNMYNEQWGFLGPVVVDTAGGKEFGAVVEDVLPSYKVGETVAVTFQSACPRNNIRTNGTFLTVERKAKSGEWELVYTDNDISTKFDWQRPHMLSSESTAKITWDIPQKTAHGTYRIRHFGDYKHLSGDINPFEGTSGEFVVQALDHKKKIPIWRQPDFAASVIRQSLWHL